MRLVHYRHADRTGFGQLVGDRVQPIETGPDGLRPFLLGGAVARPIGDPIALDAVTLLPPIADPAKILCVGLNYHEHLAETGREAKGYPTIFTRFADTQIGHDAAILAPSVSQQVDYEGEMAIVIGTPGHHIAEADALDHIGGYACYNDVSVRDWQKHGLQWTPGKNFPGTGAFGPWLVTAEDIADPAALKIETRLNGETVQSASTQQLIFSLPRIIAYLSSFTPLGTGDVICTGTPGGVGFARKPPLFLKPGDRVEVEIESIGILSNPVVAA